MRSLPIKDDLTVVVATIDRLSAILHLFRFSSFSFLMCHPAFLSY